MSQAGRLGGGGSGTSREPITRYVVDGGGTGEYTTIQDALDAASAAGLSAVLIYIKPGDYTENLNIPDMNICFMGDDTLESSYRDTKIIGEHTLNSSEQKSIDFKSLYIYSENGNIFPLNASRSQFDFVECKILCLANNIFQIGDYTINYFTFTDCSIGGTCELASTNNGWANCIFTSSSVSCNITLENDGYIIAKYSTFLCDITLTNTDASDFIHCFSYRGTITLDGTSIDSYKSFFGKRSSDVVFHLTNQSVAYLYDTAIYSSAANVITGDAGSTVYLDHVNFINSNGISTVTVAYAGKVRGNSIDMDLDVRGREMVSDGDSGAGTAGTVQYTATIDEALSTGNGTVLMKTANPGDSSGWLKIFANGNVRYIPYWTNISP